MAAYHHEPVRERISASPGACQLDSRRYAPPGTGKTALAHHLADLVRECARLGLPEPDAGHRRRIEAVYNLTPGDFAVLARRHRFQPLRVASASRPASHSPVVLSGGKIGSVSKRDFTVRSLCYRGDALRNLSKSKLLAFRQCPKRMWLEVHEPGLRKDSPGTEATFRTGHEVGEVARRLYDPKEKGALVEVERGRTMEALARSRTLLETAQPVFEAGFSAEGALAFADIMLPVKRQGRLEWRMVEVKSSTSVKDYHRDDAAIQAFIARSAGVRLSSISLAHIDNKWVYPGEGTYDGLLVEEDLTQETLARMDEVKGWLDGAHAVAEQAEEPKRTTGLHCNTPFECGFASYCKSKEPQAEHSAEILPRLGKKIRAYMDEKKVIELKEVPDELLSPLQLRVKRHTLSGKRYFDAKGAAAELARHKLPALFLDFETIFFGVPIWKGTRPYQQVPFQFSLHHLSKSGALAHSAFLSLDGLDPSKAFAQALVGVCGESEPVFVYNAGFEKGRITELADRFPALRKQLLAITGRLVDLLPVAQNYYYHPSQEGSWSIKSVLPAVVPELDYDDLKDVQDGGMAMDAFVQAIHSEVTAERKAQLEQALLEYCKLDTYAMVRIWQVFAGRMDLKL